MPRSQLAICPTCGRGKLIVVNTLLVGNSRVRYRGCRRCGYRPEGNKEILGASSNRNNPQVFTGVYNNSRSQFHDEN